MAEPQGSVGGIRFIDNYNPGPGGLWQRRLKGRSSSCAPPVAQSFFHQPHHLVMFDITYNNEFGCCGGVVVVVKSNHIFPGDSRQSFQISSSGNRITGAFVYGTTKLLSDQMAWRIKRLLP